MHTTYHPPGSTLRTATAALSAAVTLALSTGLVLAAAGDPAQPSFTPPGPAGSGCSGIGVAYDGADIFYTCADEAAIRKTDLAGTDRGAVATADGANVPVAVDAIAWDSNENVLWGGNLAEGTCRIWSIDTGSGLATLRFSFVDPHGGCNFAFFDGLTVDTVTDTLWLSPDIHGYVHHYTKIGVELPADLIDFETLTSGPDRCPFTEPFPDNPFVAGCNNSGLTIGLDGNLFAGTNGEGKIMQIAPGPPATLIGEFASVGGRDEDLECGPLVNGIETILSRKFEFPGAIDILEAPRGTCRSPVIPPPPPEEICGDGVDNDRDGLTDENCPVLEGRMTGGGTVGGDAIARHGFELHCDGSLPNRFEVNWGKNRFRLEQMTAAACIDDPAIGPDSSPTAGFDTFRGRGTGLYNGTPAAIEWTLVDAGEPGTLDTARILITDSSAAIIFTASGALAQGNHQAHDD